MPINRDFVNLLREFHSDKFQTLWEAQEHILRSYAETFSPEVTQTQRPTISATDIAIELPTGAGKTLIALMIAEAWRKERKKVAILSANKTLARQMKREADALGIPTVLMEGSGDDIPAASKRTYQRAQSTAIMNYWVYFNQNPKVDPADLLIMDDAHLTEHCLHSLYSVEITKFQHKTLFEELITALMINFPDYSILADALAKDTNFQSAAQLLSFIDQIEIAERFRELIDSSSSLTLDESLRFRWERIRRKLNEANIYISTTSIWIRPYIYPLLSNDHYKKAQQRLYFSATVGDPSDLSRRLGTNPIQKIPVPSQYTEKTSGRRLVLMGKAGNEEYLENLYKILLRSLQIHPKSVWLCSSNTEAKHYKESVSERLRENDLHHDTWLLTSQGDEIEKFKKASKGHLFVAGRFDGMDFKGDECRLVVIPTIPRAINIQEEFICEYLRDASFVKKRTNQRIVQALGRCNRSDSDFGIYILLDKRFAGYFSTDSSREGLPKNIIAEIDMAQDLADGDTAIALTEVEDFLQGNFDHYDLELEGYLASVPDTFSPPQGEPDTSKYEVTGWNALFASQNYHIAEESFKKCWDTALVANLIEVGAFHGWHRAKALYLQSLLNEPSARENALHVLEEAIRRGGQSTWFNRMNASLNRARHSSSIENIIQKDCADIIIRKFDDFLEELGVKEQTFERQCKKLSDALESNNHKQYQEGLKRLGSFLGYDVMIPQSQGATDCLWRGVFGNSREVFTFEAKIEHQLSQRVTFTDVGQANNQIIRARSEYPEYTVRGTIVTHLTDIASEAEAAADGIKIIEKEAILELWKHVKLVLSQYRKGWSDNQSARRMAALAIRAHLPKTGWLIRVFDNTPERFIDAKSLCKDWL